MVISVAVAIHRTVLVFKSGKYFERSLDYRASACIYIHLSGVAENFGTARNEVIFHARSFETPAPRDLRKRKEKRTSDYARI